MNKSDLEKMFVGKKVRITSVYGPVWQGNPEIKEGICVAIHETPDGLSPFDIEIQGGYRAGFAPTITTASSVSCLINKMKDRTRTIEVIS